MRSAAAAAAATKANRKRESIKSERATVVAAAVGFVAKFSRTHKREGNLSGFVRPTRIVEQSRAAGRTGDTRSLSSLAERMKQPNNYQQQQRRRPVSCKLITCHPYGAWTKLSFELANFGQLELALLQFRCQ